MQSCTEDRFLKDVRNHQMEIIRSDGINRHLRFRKPGTIIYGFDILTWPGHLCISGDCGTYVFRRIEDMFEFFRTGIKGDQLRINPGYWSEKAVSVDRHGGVKKFSADKFQESIKEYFEENSEIFDNKGLRDECWKEINDRVLCCVSSAFEAYDAVQRFEYEGFTFQDFWEVDSDEYDFLFLWNLYAIVWGVRKFDEEV